MADIDSSRVFLPSRLPIMLPDGTRYDRDALLIGPYEYAFAFVKDSVAEMIESGRLKPEIIWNFDRHGSHRAVELVLRPET